MNETDKMGLVGLLVGLSVGSLLTFASGGPKIKEIDLFETNDGIEIARVYRGGTDVSLILVKDDETYIPLNKYLNGIEDPAEREMEKVKIRAAAGWYE